MGRFRTDTFAGLVLEASPVMRFNEGHDKGPERDRTVLDGLAEIKVQNWTLNAALPAA